MSSQSDAPPARVRSERLVARVDTEQKRLFQHAANLQGRTLSDFLIASAQEAAQRTIDRQAMVLNTLNSASLCRRSARSASSQRPPARELSPSCSAEPACGARLTIGRRTARSSRSVRITIRTAFSCGSPRTRPIPPPSGGSGCAAARCGAFCADNARRPDRRLLHAVGGFGTAARLARGYGPPAAALSSAAGFSAWPPGSRPAIPGPRMGTISPRRCAAPVRPQRNPGLCRCSRCYRRERSPLLSARKLFVAAAQPEPTIPADQRSSCAGA